MFFHRIWYHKNGYRILNLNILRCFRSHADRSILWSRDKRNSLGREQFEFPALSSDGTISGGERVLSNILSDADLGILFRDARTYSAWLDKEVSPILLEAIYDLAKMGPTSLNCNPLRVVYLTTRESRERLRPMLSKGNLEKTMLAPVTAILAWDTQFYDLLPKLFPHSDARASFEGKPDHSETTGFRNSSLQGAYFVIAARAVGLDCGPMSGFDNAKLDAEFFPDGRFKSNFLCNLGYGDATNLRPRSPRPDFDEACQIL